MPSAVFAVQVVFNNKTLLCKCINTRVQHDRCTAVATVVSSLYA